LNTQFSTKTDLSETTQQITIKYLSRTVVMQIGNPNATVNGTPATMPVPPYISDEGRTMIPLRFVVENLGLYVYWNDASQSITINF
jgi:N-acetylmuramoyl-L-alanine amidase